jgi:hypothetical protein
MQRSYQRHLTASVLVGALAFIAAPPARAAPYEIPAHWAGWPTQARPLGVDFQFRLMRKLPTAGIVIPADHLVLRIASGSPYVTLGWKHGFGERLPPDNGVAELANGDLVFAGWERVDEPPPSSNTLLARGHSYFVERSAKGHWRDFPAPPVPKKLHDWSVTALVQGAKAGDFYAIIREEVVRRPFLATPWDQMPPNPVRPAHVVYHFSNGAWTELPSVWPTPAYALVRMCLLDDGAILVTGSHLDIDEAGRGMPVSGFVARYAGDSWAATDLPAPSERHAAWVAGAIVCGAGGRAWVSGSLNRNPDKPLMASDRRLALLYGLEGEGWRRLALPALDVPPPGPPPVEGDQQYSTVAVAHTEGPDGKLWVSYRRGMHTTDALYAFDGSAWERYPLPEVPTVAYYWIEDMVFDDEGTGWAIANRWGSAVKPEGYGILLRFDGHEWRHQNWAWSPLRQRWFGLLGDLR